MSKEIKTLLFSTLYPNSVRPNHGIFVETRLRQLLASDAVETSVVAPVPWFPFRGRIFGEYARFAAVPRQEVRNGIEIQHPRYLLLPKIGMNNAPRALARAGLAAARKLVAAGYDFDLIDAHYFYPDGVAATMIGKALGKPVVITARGSDINQISGYARPRAMILDAIRDSAATITVSAALKQKIVSLGGTAEKITVLRNGVDLDLFYAEDRDAARAKIGVSRYAIASVGNLIQSKGHHLVIEALQELPDVELFIVGGGYEERRFRRLAAELGVAGRVRFLGILPQQMLRTLYSAVDCLVLASAREGWPNVLLEAMACGTPVLATRVGGVPEIVTPNSPGLVIDSPDSLEIARTVVRLRNHPPSRKQVLAYARQFEWKQVTDGQLALFRQILVR